MRCMRVSAGVLVVLAFLAGCGAQPTGPAGQLSTTNVNPVSGSRGGNSAR